MDKFVEKTGKQRWYLNKFLISLYSGLIILFLGKSVDIWIKKRQTKPQLIEDGTFYHLTKLRSKYPPFVYSLEYDNYTELRAFKFIKISKQWFYKLKIANLTNQRVQNINIRINYPCNKYKLSARNDYIKNYSYTKNKYKWIYPSRNTGSVNYILPELDSGVGITVEIRIFAEDIPEMDKFDIFLKCPEGKFEKITPLQYKQIGWIPSIKQ